MKKYLIVVIVLLSGINSFAQNSNSDSSKVKHEISIIIEDIFEKNSFPYYYEYYDRYDYIYYDQFNEDNSGAKIGLAYRLHFNNYAIRARVLFSSNNNTQNVIDNNQAIYSRLNLGSFIGVERHLNINKAQLFYGFDFGLSKKKMSYKFDDFILEEYRQESDVKETSVIFSPLLGFKYHFHPAISISTELRFNIEKFYTDYQFKSRDTFDGSVSLIENKKDGLKTKLGPVGFLSLNFHF